jgi:hypothetical protein
MTSEVRLLRENFNKNVQLLLTNMSDVCRMYLRINGSMVSLDANLPTRTLKQIEEYKYHFDNVNDNVLKEHVVLFSELFYNNETPILRSYKNDSWLRNSCTIVHNTSGRNYVLNFSGVYSLISDMEEKAVEKEKLQIRVLKSKFIDNLYRIFLTVYRMEDETDDEMIQTFERRLAEIREDFPQMQTTQRNGLTEMFGQFQKNIPQIAKQITDFTEKAAPVYMEGIDKKSLQEAVMQVTDVIQNPSKATEMLEKVTSGKMDLNELMSSLSETFGGVVNIPKKEDIPLPSEECDCEEEK